MFSRAVESYFNRAISAWLSRAFLALRFSPNAITMVGTAIGMFAAVAFTKGSYATGLLGALRFPRAAIVDCCEGEVARVTFTDSPFGEQLDIITENVVHMTNVFWIMLAWTTRPSAIARA